MDSTSRKKTLAQQMEDYALVRIPSTERKHWGQLTILYVGFGTSLYFLLVGGLTTMAAGYWLAMLANGIAAVAAVVFVALVALSSQREGLCADLTSRAFGFGRRGSVLPSLVYAFTLIGLLGLENSIIGHALQYVFKLPDNLLVNLLIYVPLAALWTVIVIFGIDIVTRAAQIGLVAMAIFFVLVVVQMPMDRMAEAFSHGSWAGMPPWLGFAIALNIAIGPAGLAGLYSADYARYARRERDVIPLALVMGGFCFFVMPAVGGIIAVLVFPTLSAFFISQGVPESAAAMAVGANPGMAFAVLGGFLGLLMVIFSQLKIQTMNAYGASLALSNIFAMGLNWKPGRAWAVVVANIISLLFIFGGILGLVNEFLTLLSAFTSVWATIIITDYFIVRRGLKLAPPSIRDIDLLVSVNWLGIVSWIVAVAVAMFLFYTNVFQVPFVIGVPIGLVVYTALSVATKGKYSHEVTEARPAGPVLVS